MHLLRHHKTARDEWIARAETLRSKFQRNLFSLIDWVNCEHAYSTCPITATYYEVENVPPPLHLVRSLYEEHVCISPSEAVKIEACTRSQTLLDLWRNERKLKISALIMKTVCHRKHNTNVKSFITSKLSPKAIKSPAINYGKVHEDTAIKCYIEYQKYTQLIICKCGLYINPAIPWLAATLDSVVEIDQEMRCFEVKCPFVCKTKQTAVAALEQPSFCLQSNNSALQLKRTHPGRVGQTHVW